VRAFSKKCSEPEMEKSADCQCAPERQHMISFKDGDKTFNFRLGAIIISRDRTRVLLHTIVGYGFYLLPGGRLEFMESSIDGIKRELKEELGLEGIEARLIATVENFFVFKQVHFHEVSDDYVVYLTSDHSELEQHDRVIGLEGQNYIFDWVPISALDDVTVKPPLLRDIIRSHDQGVQRYVLDERITV
jgi:8-oxo-dGTP pyrophosphatase MutT (NUDIX family)